MAQVLTVTPDPQNPDGPTRVVRINDANRTEQQVRILCSILAEVRQPLYFVLETGQQAEVDPRIKDAAAETYALAAAQLRNIIDDQARWSHHEPDSERYLERLAAANLKVAEEQRHLLASRSLPHVALGARIQRIQRADTNELTWIAFIGSEPRPDGLIGLGPSPEAAFAAFDHAYSNVLEHAPEESEGSPHKSPRKSPHKSPRKSSRKSPRKSAK